MALSDIIQARLNELPPVELPNAPQSLGDVDAILEEMGALDAVAAENEQLAAEACRRTNNWLELENGKLKHRRDALSALVEAYAREHRDEMLKTGKKSRSLPHGKIAWRQTGGKLVRDEGPEAEAQLLAWAKATRPLLLVRTKEVPAWDEIQKFCAPKPNLPHVVPPGTHWEEIKEFGSLAVTPTESALAKKSDR